MTGPTLDNDSHLPPDAELADDTPVTFEEFERLIGERAGKLSPDQLRAVWESTNTIPPARFRQILSGFFDGAVAFVHVAPPDSTARRTLMAYPQAVFKPTGLWLWGCDATTLIHNMKVGNITGYSISHVALPGLYFEAGLSFAEFEKLLDSPTAEWSHERLRALPPFKEHQIIRLNTAEVGNNIVLDVEGPLMHAVMWGKTVL